jgi:hypothetical protein
MKSAWSGLDIPDELARELDSSDSLLVHANARSANFNSVGVNGHNHVRYRNLGSFDIGYSSKIEDQSESVCFLLTIPRG